MCLSPKEAVFKKSEESSQHFKPLYIRGHSDGMPISRKLIDGNTAVNLMLYAMFKKLGQEDDELVKTNLMLNGVISLELTMRSKLLAIMFFVVEVQGNYSVILDHNWIHANHCIPYTLHQFLI
jgi:hypothetical protein